MSVLKYISLPALFLASCLATAGQIEDQIKTNVAPLLEGVAIERVEYSKNLDLYEIITPRGIFYTNRLGSHVIFGATVVDTKNKKNLTEERMELLGAFDFAKLPFENAIKVVKGNGSRKMVTLEDPNCGYCKKLSQELTKIDNVTIYTFLTPILSSDSADKSRGVWCAPDKSKAWHELMLNGKAPAGDKDCAVPISKNLELYQKLRIQGTPAILFSDNTRANGFVTADKIEPRLKR